MEFSLDLLFRIVLIFCAATLKRPLNCWGLQLLTIPYLGQLTDNKAPFYCFQPFCEYLFYVNLVAFVNKLS